jgi:hypothetical protein
MLLDDEGVDAGGLGVEEVGDGSLLTWAWQWDTLRIGLLTTESRHADILRQHL